MKTLHQSLFLYSTYFNLGYSDFIVGKRIDFTALKSRLNPSQFMVADDDEKNIHKMHPMRLQLAFKDLSAGSV